MSADSPRDRERVAAPDAVARRIGRAVAFARAALVWEVAWRSAIVPIGLVGLFVAAAWLGVFSASGEATRGALLFLFALAIVGSALFAAVRVWRRRAAWDRRAALGRIEAASGLTGRELSGYEDRLPAGVDDPTTLALWATHRRRLAERLGRLAVGVPRPDLGRRDRLALRPLLGMILFIGWFAASGDHWAPIAAAFRFDGAGEAGARLDAWIDPPALTGQAAIVLSGGVGVGRDASAPIVVPVGSRLVVRAAAPEGARAPKLEIAAQPDGAVTASAAEAEGKSVSGGASERAVILSADGDVRVLRDGREAAHWRISVIPDQPPRITLVSPPTAQGNGPSRIGHETDDDWGVVSAEARFALPSGGHPLVEAPRFALTLPPGRAHRGRAETIHDLSTHPLAGARLPLTLVARDGAGQEGSSGTVEVVIPERRFRAPVARALVELRRRLALDAGMRDRVATALEALALAPERFQTRPGIYLGLKLLAGETDRARGDDDLRAVLEGLWAVALTLDLGDVANEAKALESAAEALRNALRSGASPEEIARLTQELRKALDAFLKAQSEAAQRDPRRPAGAGKTITPGDLSRMLDRIEKLGQAGSREAAEQLLSELGDIVGNLKPQGSGEEGEGAPGPLDRLGDVMRRQRKLMEDTHRGDREGGDAEALAREQGQLRKELGEISRGRKGEAGDPKGAPDGPGAALGEADGAMGEAGDALKRGDGEAATEAQGRALEAMRRGARGMAEEMRAAEGAAGAGGGEGEEDPLGRSRRAKKSGGKVAIPEEIDTERARQVLDDIRRRLADPQRPRLERDYLDRLLKLD